MRALLTALLMAFAWPDGMLAQAPPADTIAVRSFDAQELAELKADPDYDYDRDLRLQPGWWEQFKDWLSAWIEGLTNKALGEFIGTNLFYLLCALVIIAALIILSRSGLRAIFHGEPRGQGEVTVADEDIRGMDLDALIREAEEAGDLRRAVRLHYLLVLRRLVDRGVLHWSPAYTDRDYMRQVEDEMLRARFAQVALVFQWVWYGHAEVDAERYDAIKRPFVEFETMPVP